MIGHQHTSRYFRQNLGYCLKDKLTPEIDGEQRQIAYRHRAEIIYFNQCYGSRPELVRQFREVTELNRNICDPYLNIVLGLPPQDRLTNSQWADISVECSKALGFEQHQYIAIRHGDTSHEHVHLLVNRIGFEGDVVKDRYLLPRISQFCRQTEVNYGLTQLLGPRRYLTEEQRQAPRQDERLLRLREAIALSLRTACTIPAFEEDMRAHGYKVYRNEQGIAFHEEKMVIHRGSTAGYPWKKIEHILGENAALVLKQKQELEQRQSQEIAEQERLVQRQRYCLHL